MINLQITGVYDMGLKGKRNGFAVVMKDQFGNNYQTNLMAEHIYTNQIKKSFQRMRPLRFPGYAVDLGSLFTTA